MIKDLLALPSLPRCIDILSCIIMDTEVCSDGKYQNWQTIL